MKRNIVTWVERLFYAPSQLDRLISFSLYPLSLLYCAIVWFRFKTSKVIDFKIPIVSVGNLTVGGSGKTPLVSALALEFKKPCVVLRGYGRESQGLVIVSDGSKITCNVRCSGDEAMIYAKKLPHAVVIVSEKRDSAIVKAKELGCEVVFLDDGYSKHHIKKYDILIDVTSPNNFCLPAGPFRERLWKGKYAYIAYENKTFKRVVTHHDLTEKMVLVTAIARPERLNKFLPKNVLDNFYFPDHHYFSKDELVDILEQSGATSLLVTYKDYVKIVDFNLPLSLMDLELEVESQLIDKINGYVKYELGVAQT